MMAGLADLEKDLISERRKAGIERAKAEGSHGETRKSFFRDCKDAYFTR